jgi:hypothetical protein
VAFIKQLGQCPRVAAKEKIIIDLEKLKYSFATYIQDILQLHIVINLYNSQSVLGFYKG